LQNFSLKDKACAELKQSGFCNGIPELPLKKPQTEIALKDLPPAMKEENLWNAESIRTLHRVTAVMSPVRVKATAANA
jgi:hypothetical protein